MMFPPSLWMCPHQMARTAARCLMKSMTMSTVFLHFRVCLWAWASPPPASPVRTPLVSLVLRNGPVVEIIGTLLSRTAAYMTCLLWPPKSSLTPPHPPPHLLAASPFRVTVQATCSGEPRSPALSTQCWAQPPARRPRCRHGTWPPHWLKSCPPGKPVTPGILHRLFSRPGLACRTFCQR